VTPSSYLSAKSFRYVRKWLLEELKLDLVVEFPYRYWPFEDVNTETTITIGGCNKAKEKFETYRVLKEHITVEGKITETSKLASGVVKIVFDIFDISD